MHGRVALGTTLLLSINDMYSSTYCYRLFVDL